MIRSGGESKITLVGRRMFILSAAKAIVVLGIVGRLISLQITESKKYKTLPAIKFAASSLQEIILRATIVPRYRSLCTYPSLVGR